MTDLLITLASWVVLALFLLAVFALLIAGTRILQHIRNWTRR